MVKYPLSTLRHSTSHVLAQAVLRLYPDTKLGIGPPTDKGFYYDLQFKKPINENDLKKIEDEMRQVIEEGHQFERLEYRVGEAEKIAERTKQLFKKELLKDLKKEGTKTVSFYKSGEFFDLCEGPHIKNTKEIPFFKLLSLAGAYWRGNEKNPMLTRIYGTTFFKKEELADFLKTQEEAKKRDHRKLGKELELFTFSDQVGPGLVLWLPKGTVIKEELEKLGKETEAKGGYQRVSTPQVAKEELYFTSGHLPYFKDEMFPKMESSEGNYYLKPMNCPHTHMIFKSKMRSYKELPLRLAEYGSVYRFEKSGELTGLLRVRGMTQNDAHIYCTGEEVLDELVEVMKIHKYYYDLFQIKKFWIELSLPDFEKRKEKYFADQKGWQKSVDLLRQAAKKSNLDYTEEEGAAAFYGPKFDFNIESAIGRVFGASTNQLDFGSAERFGLTYIEKGGKERTIPYIIHRAPLGSDERFIGFLIEHYGGTFPVWLSPVQVAIIPISDKFIKYAKTLFEKLFDATLRVEIDEENKTVQAKIRDKTLQKIPYLLIVGEKEERTKTVAVRERSGKDLGKMTVERFLRKLKEEIENKK